jgi:hypothetical protein
MHDLICQNQQIKKAEETIYKTYLHSMYSEGCCCEELYDYVKEHDLVSKFPEIREEKLEEFCMTEEEFSEIDLLKN